VKQKAEKNSRTRRAPVTHEHFDGGNRHAATFYERLSLGIALLSAFASGISCWIAWDAQSSAAEEAAKALAIQSENHRREERAYIGLAGSKILMLAAGRRGKINLVFRNTGRTPALDAYALVNDEIIPFADLANARVTGEGREFVRPVPAAIHDIGSRLFEGDLMTPEIISGIRSGELAWVIMGVMKYKDVFGEAHETRFCGYARGSPVTMGLCADGNTVS
jgi:hypothetical protein